MISNIKLTMTITCLISYDEKDGLLSDRIQAALAAHVGYIQEHKPNIPHAGEVQHDGFTIKWDVQVIG